MSTTNNNTVAAIRAAVNQNSYDWNTVPVVRIQEDGSVLVCAERVVHGSILRTIFNAEEVVIIDHDGSLPEDIFALGGKDAFAFARGTSIGTLAYIGNDVLEAQNGVNYAKLQSLMLHGKSQFTAEAMMVVVDTDLTTDGRAWANNAWLQMFGDHKKIIGISTLDRAEFLSGNYSGHKGMVTNHPASPEWVDNTTSTPVIYVGRDYVKAAGVKPAVGSMISIHVAVIEDSPAWESYRVTFGAQTLRFYNPLPAAFKRIVEMGIRSAALHSEFLCTEEGLRMFYGAESLEDLGLEDNQVMSAKVKALMANLPMPGRWISDLAAPAITKSMKEAIKIKGWKSRLYSNPELDTFNVLVPKGLEKLVGRSLFAKRDPMALAELVAVTVTGVSELGAFEVSQNLTTSYLDGDDDGDHVYFIPTMSGISEQELREYNRVVTKRVAAFEKYLSSHVSGDHAARPITPAEAAIRAVLSKRAIQSIDGELQGAYEAFDGSAEAADRIIATRFLVRRAIDSAKHVEFDVPAADPKAPRQSSLYRFLGGKMKGSDDSIAPASGAKALGVIIDGMTYRNGNLRKTHNLGIAKIYDSIRESVIRIHAVLSSLEADGNTSPYWTAAQESALNKRMAQSQDYANAHVDEQVLDLFAKYDQYLSLFKVANDKLRGRIEREAARESALLVLREIRGMTLNRNTKMVMLGLSLRRTFAGLKGYRSLTLLYGSFAIEELLWLSAQASR